MCFSAMAIAAAASAAAAAGGLYNAHAARKDARDAGRRAESDRLRAESEAAQRASAATAMQRRALRSNSLFTGAGDAGGRTTLGV